MAKRTGKSKRTKPSVNSVPYTAEYEIKAIVGEAGDQYEVQWTNTWVLKDWVNAQAVKAWEKRQLEVITARDGSDSPLSSIEDAKLEHPSALTPLSGEAASRPEQADTSNEQLAFEPRAQALIISSTTEHSSIPVIPDSYENSAQDFHTFPDAVLDTVEKDASGALQSTQQHQMASLPAVPPHLMEEMVASLPGSPHDGGRSPSAISALYRSPIVSTEEMNTSERYGTLFPPSEAFSSHSRTYQDRSPTDLEGEHHLGLPLLGTQRDQYQTTPELHYHGLISDFLDTPDDQVTDEMLTLAEELIDRLRLIALHPDLDTLEALTQFDVEPSRKADWYAQGSSKFTFLAMLLASTDSHVAIAADDGRLLQILQAFLEGKQLNTPIVSKDTEIAGMDIVIDLDGSYEGGILTTAGTPALWVSLMSKYTIEHIQRSLPADVTRIERAKMTLAAVQEYKLDAGRSQETQTTIHELSNTLAAFLSHREDVWPLPELGPVDMTFTMGSVSSSTSEANGKRARSSSVSEPAPSDIKRVKLDPDIDHHRPERQAKLTLLHTQYNQLEASFGIVQSELEDTRTTLHAITRERDSAQSTAKSFQDRLATNTTRTSDLRKKITDLEEQLEQSNIALTNHIIPERAEFEAQRLAALQSEQLVQKTQGRLESLKKDLEYSKNAYQQASSQAANLAAENRALVEQLTIAQAAASKEKARLKALSNDVVAQNLFDEIRRLEAMSKSFQHSIRLKDEEIARLKDTSRGRIGTRNSSVPRSPRMSSPMKARSRQASPAAGEPRARLHPLRNGV